jgi:hypothetical protein
VQQLWSTSIVFAIPVNEKKAGEIKMLELRTLHFKKKKQTYKTFIRFRSCRVEMYRRRVNAILIRKKLNIFWVKESVVWPAMACRISLESLYLKQTCDGPSIKLICFSFACSPKVLYTFSYFSKSCSFFPSGRKVCSFLEKKILSIFQNFCFVLTFSSDFKLCTCNPILK